MCVAAQTFLGREHTIVELLLTSRMPGTVACIAGDLYADHLVQVDDSLVQRIDLRELTQRNNGKVFGSCLRM